MKNANNEGGSYAGVKIKLFYECPEVTEKTRAVWRGRDKWIELETTSTALCC